MTLLLCMALGLAALPVDGPPPAAPVELDDDSGAEIPRETSAAARLGWTALALVGGTLAGLGAGGVTLLIVEAAVALVVTGFIGFIVARNGMFTAQDAQSLPVDALLYFLLFSLFAAGPALAAAVATDAVVFGLVSWLVPPRSTRTALAAVVAALATVPAVMLAVLGGVVLAVWLGVQALPDVLMVVGMGALVVAAVLFVASVVVVRPLIVLISRLLGPAEVEPARESRPR